MVKKIILTALLLILPRFILISQENPFFSENKSVEQPRAPQSPGLLQGIMNGINSLQRELNAAMSELSRKVNEERNVAVFFVLLAAALAYGVVHALGPGHGKIIMMSYALANPLKARQGVLLGVGIAVIHTLSAVVLVSLLYLILQSSYSDYSREPQKIISLVSYGLIAGMGVFLFVRILLQAVHSNANGADPQNKPDDRTKKIRDLIFPAFLIGCVPCEGAILILIFSISIGSFWLGIILSAAMSVGMAITIAAAGLAAVFSKKGALRLFSKKKTLTRTALLIIQFLGAGVIIVFGVLLFLSNLV